LGLSSPDRILIRDGRLRRKVQLETKDIHLILLDNYLILGIAKNLGKSDEKIEVIKALSVSLIEFRNEERVALTSNYWMKMNGSMDPLLPKQPSEYF
jgi:hypothetical protein